MNRRSSLPRSPRIKCHFDLSDSAERDTLRWIQGFHAPRSIYRLLNICRGNRPDGKRVVLLLTRVQPQRRGAKPEWLMISYIIDEIHVILLTYPTRTAAEMAFRAAAAGLTPPVGSPAARTPA